MQEYRHRQIGYVIVAALGIAIIFCFAIFVQSVSSEARIGVVAIAVVLLFALVAFWSLNVKVNTKEICVWFGPGLIRKSISIDQIRAVQAVRNRWYYGWGIRLTPHGWLYNVSGLDAVEVEFQSGKKFRIGTDDTEKLLAAIENACQPAAETSKSDSPVPG